MLKFETIGVNLQKDSDSPEESVSKFQISCEICSTRGMKLDCDRCAIKASHSLVMASFGVMPEESVV